MARDFPQSSEIWHGDNLELLAELPDESFTVIYIDPPFNTGRSQARHVTTAVRSEPGVSGSVGFKGKSYQRIRGELRTYDDTFDDYWTFLEPRLLEAWRLLGPEGTLYVHLDYREAHYAKVMLDAIFGRDSFLNELIWAYDYGAKATRRWPTKHDTILVYVKDPAQYHFDSTAVDREPYMAPGLVTPQKAARGKLPTDVWWHTIVSPTGKEKTGYPTQKPLGILRRIIQASSREGDWILDFFAGSGTTGAAARELGRNFVLIDQNPQAIEVMRRRFGMDPDADSADTVVPPLEDTPATRAAAKPKTPKAPAKPRAKAAAKSTTVKASSAAAKAKTAAKAKAAPGAKGSDASTTVAAKAPTKGSTKTAAKAATVTKPRAARTRVTAPETSVESEAPIIAEPAAANLAAAETAVIAVTESVSVEVPETQVAPRPRPVPGPGLRRVVPLPETALAD